MRADSVGSGAGTVGSGVVQYGSDAVFRAYEYRQDLMYLSMVNLHIESRFLYGKSKWPSYFVVKFWRSGSFRVRSWG